MVFALVSSVFLRFTSVVRRVHGAKVYTKKRIFSALKVRLNPALWVITMICGGVLCDSSVYSAVSFVLGFAFRSGGLRG